jgi:hypothetical protein
MNWGKGIIIGMSAFIVFIVTLISILMSNSVDLVSEDYYQKEISFGDEMTAKGNYNQLQEKMLIETSDELLIVKLPNVDGVNEFTLEMKRPNDEKQDKTFKITDTKTFILNKNQLQKGVYTFTLSFKNKNQQFLAVDEHYVQ